MFERIGWSVFHNQNDEVTVSYGYGVADGDIFTLPLDPELLNGIAGALSEIAKEVQGTNHE